MNRKFKKLIAYVSSFCFTGVLMIAAHLAIMKETKFMYFNIIETFLIIALFGVAIVTTIYIWYTTDLI